MAGGAAKRSSDDCVFADTKKKKISKKDSKEKRDVDMLKDKTKTDCNGDIRQKKAFFAYFGKSFDEGKNLDGVKTNTNELLNEQTIEITTANDDDDFLQMVVVKSKAKIFMEKQNAPHPTNTFLMKRNANLPFISCFVEESGYFPKVTHTNRLAPLNSSEIMLCLKEETLHNENFKNSTFSFQTLNSIPERLTLEPYQMEINIPYMISSLKKSVPDFPVSYFHKHIRKKHLVSKKSITNNETMWIDKYKPMCKEEVLGNSELIKCLKNWLEPAKKDSIKSKKSQRNDDDDFIFDSDSDSSNKAQHNLAVLLGPSGCGKTSAVYAVANELNANVIELNSSCNRNGKRIITDLMEATQSHAVEKNYCLLNMLIKEKNNKTKKIKDANEKMTIILIEDADIFFDNYDDGFISAISTLATDSKRPLVLIANDPFSNHLLKFVLSNEITLNFLRPKKEDLSCFLQLVALNEGVIMSQDEINSFIHPFKPDIRQSTLQLQYVLSTGEVDKKTLNNTNRRSINSVWWNWPYVIGYDSTSIENNKQAKCNIDIETVSQNLDTMSKLNLIYSKTQGVDFLDVQPFWYHLDTRDSASLIETNHWSDNSVQLSTDITQWIHNHINTRDYTEKPYLSSEDLNRRQRMWDISKSILEQIGLDYCNRKNETGFDYLATVRSMGRNHQVNQPFGNLRRSKMFSYLRRININIDCKELEYLCDSLLSNSNCAQSLEISDQF